MPKISRAGDNLWVVSAFDPRKPVDPNWAEKPPAPILRSGDEYHVFEDSPFEHHQGVDSMQWNPEGHGADESFMGDFFDGEREDPRNNEVLSGVPSHDLLSVGEHARRAREAGGSLEGSQGHYVEYHPTSAVNHYYTYNPRGAGDWEPWNLVSTHWAAREPIQTRHHTFDDAVGQGITNRSIIDRMVR